MPCPYPSCRSADVRRTEHGILSDKYTCKACARSYTRISPTAGRWALRTLIFGGITVLTAGLDGGLIGGAAAADFARPPERTAMVPRQSQAPATQDASISPREQAQAPAAQNTPAPQQRPEPSPPESNVGEIAKTAVITTLISIAVGLTVCVVSAGTVCVFPF
jgi:hypothetical protein